MCLCVCVCVCQTPRAWADERRRGSHKRSASCGSTDQLKEVSFLPDFWSPNKQPLAKIHLSFENKCCSWESCISLQLYVCITVCVCVRNSPDCQIAPAASTQQTQQPPPEGQRPQVSIQWQPYHHPVAGDQQR